MAERAIDLTEKFYEELKSAELARDRGSFSDEWHHLERAHILGQFHALRHLWVHILMIRFSIIHFRVREFLGQIPRIILAVPGSITGLAPKGNTGGASVGIFESMMIPEDLKQYLEGPK